jgi:IMP dehydrogenase|tara:strand:- start:1440 stop:2564 length:1125 start_codon:yes stop_codon:yes gene_type:complete
MRKFSAEDLYATQDYCLSFDDVLLAPEYTEIRSRLSPRIDSSFLRIPIISSPMDTVTESSMAYSIGSRGAMGIIHRFMPPDDQVSELRNVIANNLAWHPIQTERDTEALSADIRAPVVPAIGVGESERERFNYVYSSLKGDIDYVAIDIANGHSVLMKEMIDFVNQVTGGSLKIIAGNVATGEGFAYLAECGVSAIRVGIGGGSICKTRIMTGFGIPTFSSIIDSYITKTKYGYNNVSIIADGGIRYPSDLAKSIVAGADAIMAGRIFAGTLESPGEVISYNGEKMKVYRGMASKEVQEDKKGGLRKGTCAEGVSTYIPLKGKAYYVLDEFSGGLRSAMSYVNASNIEELRSNSSFIKITNAGLDESHAFGTKK